MADNTSESRGMEKLQEYQRKVASGEIERPVHKNPWDKLREKPTDRRRITAFCCMCMGWEEGQPMPVGVRGDIRDCTSPRCPLFDVRPYQPSTGNLAE